jgi:hypothetical protein
MVLLFLASLLLADRRRMASIMFGVFFPIALVVGDNRLNIIYLMLIVNEYLTHSRRSATRSAVLLAVGLYLSAKGLDFARSLVEGYSYFEQE